MGATVTASRDPAVTATAGWSRYHEDVPLDRDEACRCAVTPDYDEHTFYPLWREQVYTVSFRHLLGAGVAAQKRTFSKHCTFILQQVRAQC
jgi:hypothetical protein